MEIITEIGLRHFLILSALLFALGLAIVLLRRNVFFIFMGLILILNSLSINFLAFSRYLKIPGGPHFAFFLIFFSIVEVAVALALISNLKNLEVDKIQNLKG